jgi:hypothetical protein
MPIALTLVLMVFWLALAYRSFQRGDMLLAGVFLLVGVMLSVYRLRGATRSGSGSSGSSKS